MFKNKWFIYVYSFGFRFRFRRMMEMHSGMHWISCKQTKIYSVLSLNHCLYRGVVK